MRFIDYFIYIAPVTKKKIVLKTDYIHINLESFREITFDDTDIQKEIISAFIEILNEYIIVLNTEFPNKNWESLFQATHKIKPNISMFGISKLEATILKLENNFRKKEHLNTVESQIKYCLETLKEVKIELNLELKSMQND